MYSITSILHAVDLQKARTHWGCVSDTAFPTFYLLLGAVIQLMVLKTHSITFAYGVSSQTSVSAFTFLVPYLLLRDYHWRLFPFPNGLCKYIIINYFITFHGSVSLLLSRVLPPHVLSVLLEIGSVTYK